MGKIGISPGGVIDITRTDTVSLGELRGGLILKKFEKMRYFEVTKE